MGRQIFSRKDLYEDWLCKSFFANTYPNFGIPDLVKFTVTGIEVIDEAERVNKQREAKKKAAARQEEYDAQRRFVEAQRRFEEAQKELKKYSKKK